MTTDTLAHDEDLRPFFECSFLTDYDFELSSGTFSVGQDELVLIDTEDNPEEPETKQVKFGQTHTEYLCEFTESDSFNPEIPALLLCIKDNVELLEYTLDNLCEFHVDDHANVIIIDDRPEVNNIKLLCLERKYSHLKVSYDKDFSFSMINNIGAKIAKELGCKNIVLWNSDMWAHDHTTFKDLLDLHFENKAQISGTKLVYPPFRWDGDESRDGAGVSTYFKQKLQTYRGTTQFGGIIFALGGWGSFVPNHAYRFINPEHPLVNCDKGELAVTGAFNIIDLNWFIKQGGFNPSLPRIFQDIDLCLKADRVFYFGKDKYFYHDESLCTLNEESNERQMTSDNLLFARIWPSQKFADKIFIVNH